MQSTSVTTSFSMLREFFSHNYELDEDFSVLTWWKKHESQFPDILVVPALKFGKSVLLVQVEEC